MLLLCLSIPVYILPRIRTFNLVICFELFIQIPSKSFRNGVLEITIPKMPEVAGRKVKVQSGD